MNPATMASLAEGLKELGFAVPERIDTLGAGGVPIFGQYHAKVLGVLTCDVTSGRHRSVNASVTVLIQLDAGEPPLGVVEISRTNRSDDRGWELNRAMSFEAWLEDFEKKAKRRHFDDAIGCLRRMIE